MAFCDHGDYGSVSAVDCAVESEACAMRKMLFVGEDQRQRLTAAQGWPEGLEELERFKNVS
jgi:hypothetical protein